MVDIFAIHDAFDRLVQFDLLRLSEIIVRFRFGLDRHRADPQQSQVRNPTFANQSHGVQARRKILGGFQFDFDLFAIDDFYIDNFDTRHVAQDIVGIGDSSSVERYRRFCAANNTHRR